MYSSDYKTGDEDDGGDRNPYRSENKAPEFAPLPAGYKMSADRRDAGSRLRTFQDWSNDGYKILKGSKSVGRDTSGKCLFSEDQVQYTRGQYVGEDDFSELDDWETDLPGNPEDYGHSD